MYAEGENMLMFACMEMNIPDMTIFRTKNEG